MKFFWLVFLSATFAQTPELNTPPPEVVPSASPASSVTQPTENPEYEVDYEEEPSTDDGGESEEPTPTPAKTRRGGTSSKGADNQLQGSRAAKKIAPLLKSETKSRYRKNGKTLDVDPD